jgi:signal transduction histidine kinase
LRTATLEPARTERALDAIERNATAQIRLVEDLLDISRIVTGKM